MRHMIQLLVMHDVHNLIFSQSDVGVWTSLNYRNRVVTVRFEHTYFMLLTQLDKQLNHTS